MPVTISEDITGVASINGGQLGGRNYIINGAMLISQRGTSFAAVAHGEYTLDRWTANDTGAGVFTISQDTDVPNETYENSLKVDCTTADASIAAGDIYAIQQYIEGLNSIPFAMGTSGAVTVTLSFWVKSTKTGTFCVALKNADASRGYVSQYTVSDTNTWERKTITIPLDQTGTWLRTNGKGLAVMFTLACGSTRQASSADTWEAGNVSATSSQVNALDSTANNFLITGVQLEEGSTATDFEHRTFGDELALCQRYVRVYGGTGANEYISIGAASGTTTANFVIPTISMRATPTLTVSAVANWQVGNASSIACTAISLTNSSPHSINLDVTVASGLTSGHGLYMRAASTTAARLTLSAEL
jgi:hypothetical protein